MMAFDRPIFFLLLLGLPAGWIWARRQAPNAQISFALKALAYAALVIALAGPRMDLPIHRLAVTVLADTSASMPRQSIQRSEKLMSEIAKRGSLLRGSLICLMYRTTREASRYRNP
jgi:hypothetical protein